MQDSSTELDQSSNSSEEVEADLIESVEESFHSQDLESEAKTTKRPALRSNSKKTTSDDYWDLPLQKAKALRSIFTNYEYPESAKHLNPLVEALEQRDEDKLSPWVDADLLDRVVENPLLHPNVEAADSSVWDILTRVLVFLPIVWTWLSLTQASIAYGKFLERFPSRDGNSFIALWQTGFGGILDDHWSFESFTKTAALLGVIIIVFVAFTSLRTKANRHSLAKLHYNFQNVFIPALTELKISLAPHRLETLPRYKSDLSNASRTLARLNKSATDLMQDVSAVTGESVTAFKSQMDQLQAVSENMLKQSNQSLTQQQDVVEEFGRKLSKLSNSVEDLKAVLHTVANLNMQEPAYVKKLVTTLESITENSSKVTSASVQELSAIEGSLSNLVSSIGGLLKNSKQASDSTQKIIDALNRLDAARNTSGKQSWTKRVAQWFSNLKPSRKP